jgi:eukaryotic-like serine/threonine-protein kinase
MAPGDASRLLALAEAVAGRSTVDWDEAEASVDPQDVELVRELRLLAGVAAVHRSGPTLPADRPRKDDLVGSALGPLRILERIAAGSFGTVYHARDSRLARDVALKLLHASPAGTSNSSIVEEGRLLARVRHPHVVNVFGADRFGDRIGIWMEFVQGRTLAAVLRSDGPFSAREAALIGIDLCSALAAVHAQGLVHRDVKAQNVMREDGGRLVLMDFGAGGETAVRSDRMTGTPVYMAPEVLASGQATPVSDLYSLGVLLFRLVTGAYPVSGRSLEEVGREHRVAARRYLRDLRPDLPGPFVAVVERALAFDPKDRFESAGMMERALTNALLQQSPPEAPIRKRQRFGVWSAAVVGALCVLAVALLTTWPWLGTGRGAVMYGMRSLAIRPLESLSADASQAGVEGWFAAGLTDLLIADLGSIRELRVIAVPPTETTRAQADRTLLAGLGVDGMFEGSVQRNGGRVRVSAHVLSAGSGAVVWGRTYEGTEQEAFNLQSQIAADVAREIGLPPTVTASGGQPRANHLTTEAQEAYLRGRYLLDTLTRPNLQRARTEFERVVHLEPLYAPGHASLALTYLQLGGVGLLTPDVVRELATAEANAAFNIDPMLAEAALAAADVRFRLNWDSQGAEDAYRRAIELNPSYVYARGQYSRFLAALGRVDDALRVARESQQIYPLSAEIHGVVGMALIYARRYDEAIAHYRSRADSMTPMQQVGLGRACAAAGHFPEAIVALTAAVEQSGHDPSIYAERRRERTPGVGHR